MPSFRSVPLLLAALSTGIASVSPQDRQQEQCDLYLALSSTSEEKEPKLGLYAGRSYQANARIGNHEVAVQVHDLNAHSGRSAMGKKEKAKNYFSLATKMVWTADSTGAKYETDESIGGPGQTYTTIPGVGMLGNFHAGIINADWDENSTLFRTAMEDKAGGMGVTHPGRGAVSEFYNVSIAATQSIPAGCEIFVNFGQDWSEKTLKDKNIATRADYERADMQVDKMIEFFDKYENELTDSLRSQLYNFLINDVVSLSSEGEERAKIAKSLLPAKPSKLQVFKDTGGSLRHKNPEVFRDLDWLKENGRCLSNIKAGPSTIPHAGRGAFATKTIKKGEVIAPVPLMQIGHRKELDMYELEKKKISDEEEYVRKGGPGATPIGKQLLLNYCFGHPESTLLLYPFGAGSNFINHKSGSDANAKIIWSSPVGGMHHPEWLDLHPEELSDSKHRHVGLMLDVVATRTIPKGGEVFINYGAEWSKAWDEHVKKFKDATKESDSWTPTALELNSLYHKSEPGKGYELPFKTIKEAKEDPYPERVATACASLLKDIPEDDPEKYIDGIKVYDWSSDKKVVWQGISWRMCDVLDRTEFEEEGTGAKMYNYTVRIQTEEAQDATTERKVMRSVPHLAVRFVDRPYHSDQFRHEPFEPFRHEIGIPDEIFPDAWRNLKGGKQTKPTKEE